MTLRDALSERRMSRGYFGGAGFHEEPSGNGFMLARDIPLGIMPYGRSSGSESAYAARIEPHDPEVEAWLVELLDIGTHRYRDLSDAIARFVEDVANQLAYLGEQYFEVVCAESEERPAPCLLAMIPPGPMRRRRGHYEQTVPEDSREAGEPATILIPEHRIWHLALPGTHGTPKEHRQLLRQLSQMEPVAPFTLERTDFGASAGYDFAAHRRAIDIAVERLTQHWGTIPSFQRVKGTTEYYLIARRLQFLRSQAQLREHMIRELNALLARLEVASRIVIEGLPTSDRIAEQMRALEQGSIGFSGAYEASKTPD